MKKLLTLLLLLLVAPLAMRAQTYRTGFVYVGPLAGLPASCIEGRYAFATDATAGANTYACTATNTWTVQGGSGGSGISTITSTDGSLVVIDPTGPTTDLSVAGSKQTCDASTVANYQPAVCVFTLDAATLNSFDGTSGTAVPIIDAPSAGNMISIGVSNAAMEYLAGSQPFNQTSALLVYVGFGPSVAFNASAYFSGLSPFLQQSVNRISDDVLQYGVTGDVSDAVSEPLYLYISQNVSAGPMATGSVAFGGTAGYTTSDTESVNCGSFDAVITVTASGGVVTSFVISTPGTAYTVTLGCTTSVLTGSGDGTLTVNVDSVAQGNGSVLVSIPFTVIPVGVGAITGSTLDSGGDVTSAPVATITAGHAGTGYGSSGETASLACDATWTLTTLAGIPTAIAPESFNGTGCTTGGGQSTTASGIGTGLQLDVSAVNAGWNVSDTFFVLGGNDDATGHVTAVNGSKQITAYVIDDEGTGYTTGTGVTIQDTTSGAAEVGATINITAVF